MIAGRGRKTAGRGREVTVQGRETAVGPVSVSGVEGARSGTGVAARQLAVSGQGQGLTHVQGSRGEIKCTVCVADVQ